MIADSDQVKGGHVLVLDFDNGTSRPRVECREPDDAHCREVYDCECEHWYPKGKTEDGLPWHTDEDGAVRHVGRYRHECTVAEWVDGDGDDVLRGTVEVPVEPEFEPGELTVYIKQDRGASSPDWPTELTFTDQGITYPFVEDEDCNITGYGHQHPKAFAAAINAYDETVGGFSEEQWGPGDVTHRWGLPEIAVEHNGEPFDWRIRPCLEGTPDAIPITTLWGQR